MISKKMKIIGFSMLGVAITTIAIAVPLSLKKDNDGKSLSIREKLTDLTKKEIILNENSDLNLSTLANQTKIINEIKKRVSFLNDVQKKSIKLETKKGLISFKKILKIIIKITLDKKEEIFTFNFKRKTTNYDQFLILSEKVLIIESNNNINLSIKKSQDQIINFIKNQSNFLNIDEKNSIQIITKSGLIISSTPLSVKIQATFFKSKKTLSFDFIRKPSKQEETKNKNDFNKLKTKFDNLKIRKITLEESSDIDLSNDLKRLEIKTKLIDIIDKTKGISPITLEENKAIVVSNKSGIISYDSFFNINITINIGKNSQSYTFMFKRNISRLEINQNKLNALKVKFEHQNVKTKLFWEIIFKTSDQSIELSNSQNREKIKEIIIKEIQKSNGNILLSNEEKQAIIIETNSGQITYNELKSINIKIKFGELLNEVSWNKNFQFYLKDINIPDYIYENILKYKFKLKNQQFSINHNTDLDLSVIDDRIIILKSVIQKNIVSQLNKRIQWYLNFFSITKTSGIISTNYKIIQFKLSFPGKEDIFSNIKIRKKLSKIQEIENYFQTPSNLNMILPKEETLNNNAKILEEIKNVIHSKKLDKNLISIDPAQTPLSSIPNHGEAKKDFKILVNNNIKITLQLIKHQYTKIEQTQKSNVEKAKKRFNSLKTINKGDLSIFIEITDIHGKNLSNQNLRDEILKRLGNLNFFGQSSTIYKRFFTFITKSGTIPKRPGKIQVSFKIQDGNFIENVNINLYAFR